MRINELGRTGIRVSEICLGTMTWGEQNSEADGHAQLDHALANGINFVDTAEMYAVPGRKETYGATERIIGSWLQKTGRRQDIILATKIASGSRGGRSFDYMRPHLNGGETKLDRASILDACDASLKRLKTDYIDLYQLHWPERPTNCFGRLRYKHDPDDKSTPLEESLSALKELVDAGKVRAVGLSNETPWGVMECLRLADQMGLPRIASIQNPYSLLNRSFEVGLAEMAIKAEVSLLAYSPLAFGTLTGKYIGGAKPAGARLTLFGDIFPRYQGANAKKAIERYVATARAFGMDATTQAHAFVLSQPFVTSSIVGATSVDQLQAALDARKAGLTAEHLAALDAIDNDITFPCP
ncbi:NADP(H)-dependent aldo-keto reductase [Gimibacter soli]|uniref:Protein tas n=1 Tax=Gimibacter soli TaxID=3024400 RepID=A0AAE9XXU5_9PROT|nr:NADP(H)-dependent aldo-keto reductase [Gimibacter soli]WCL55764.1 NADP(H)-dependent aldo-keto reductase [Gimibacter soli]